MKFHFLPIMVIVICAHAEAEPYQNAIQILGGHLDREGPAHLVTCFQRDLGAAPLQCTDGIYDVTPSTSPDWNAAQKICDAHQGPVRFRPSKEEGLVTPETTYEPQYQSSCALVDRHFTEEKRHDEEEKSINEAVSSLSDFTNLGIAMGILK